MLVRESEGVVGLFILTAQHIPPKKLNSLTPTTDPQCVAISLYTALPLTCAHVMALSSRSHLIILKAPPSAT